MDLIYVKSISGQPGDAGYLQAYESDFEIGSENNDFEIKQAITDRDGLLYIENEVETVVYAEGTEFGGILRGSVLDIGENLVTYTGKTWRGMMDQFIIEPPEGEDYRIVSGNIADILRALPMHPIFTVEDTDYTVGQIQFDRYITTQEGIDAILEKSTDNIRVRYVYEQDALAYTGKVHVYIEEKRDLTDYVSLSQDYSSRIQMKITRDFRTPRHLICMGKGELKDREIMHLYADEDWNISQTLPADPDDAWPVETYDFSSSDDLLNDGVKHYKGIIAQHKQIEVSIFNLDIELSDIIGARDHITGEYVTAEIAGMIWKHEDYTRYSRDTFEYKTKILGSGAGGQYGTGYQEKLITNDEIDTIMGV